jgi:hypothetical protein
MTVNGSDFRYLYRGHTVMRGEGETVEPEMNINIVAVGDRPMNGMQVGLIGTISLTAFR